MLINPADILAVEAEGNYVLMRHRNDSYSLREPISNLAEKLKDYGFVRVHRSVLVNSSCVEEIHPGPTGEHTLRIIGGKEYTVSRTYKHNLKWLAQSWIGTDSFVDE
ncbi:MAG TPA: LytTR family DNA-binding domain-containing protein [Candidatus Methylomirabilis sp.]|nr:LytTR family DNA-binding domain-containing protein [Candidatus Methylomirabilis sp.]